MWHNVLWERSAMHSCSLTLCYSDMGQCSWHRFLSKGQAVYVSRECPARLRTNAHFLWHTVWDESVVQIQGFRKICSVQWSCKSCNQIIPPSPKYTFFFKTPPSYKNMLYLPSAAKCPRCNERIFQRPDGSFSILWSLRKSVGDMSRRHIIISLPCCITVPDRHYSLALGKMSAARHSIWGLYCRRYYFLLQIKS